MREFFGGQYRRYLEQKRQKELSEADRQLIREQCGVLQRDCAELLAHSSTMHMTSQLQRSDLARIVFHAGEYAEAPLLYRSIVKPFRWNSFKGVRVSCPSETSEMPFIIEPFTEDGLGEYLLLSAAENTIWHTDYVPTQLPNPPILAVERRLRQVSSQDTAMYMQMLEHIKKTK